MMLYVIILLR